MNELFNFNSGTNGRQTFLDKAFFSKFSGKHEEKKRYHNDEGRPHWYLTDIESPPGLLQKLISSLLLNRSSSFSFSSSSSSLSLDSRDWWFDDLTVLSPKILVKIVRNLVAHESNDKSFVLTRFLLHYLYSARQESRCYGGRSGYEAELDEIANIVVDRVVLTGRGALSCRRLFWVLRVVSGLNLSSSNSREQLEEMIGERLDESTLDDLLVSGREAGVYDVSLVVRLVKIFVSKRESDQFSLKKMRRVGMLVDTYLKEISPDKSLNVSEFVEVVGSLPDSARECFDDTYRALSIYIEAHPELSFEERTMLCQCLSNEKLTPEVSIELARNPKVPPEVSMRALVHIADSSKADDAGSSSSAPPANEKEQSAVNFGIVPWRLCRGQMYKNDTKSKIISYNVKNLTKI